MTIVTLDEAKQHLAITNDLQDALIDGMLAVATDASLRYIGGHPDSDPVPEVLRGAILMHVAAIYEGREGASLPEEAQSLLKDLREWVFG